VWEIVNFILRNNKLFIFTDKLRSIPRKGIKKTLGDFTRKSRRLKTPLEVFISLPKRERNAQSKMIFPKKVKISIIISLYNTPKQYLIDMIESALSQTYKNLELCLVDGSDKDHSYVRQLCKVYSQNDSRIKYKKVNNNIGVSERLNKAVGMSTGDFLGLLHQSDILHPSALYEIMKIICYEDADFIYTDEALFSQKYHITFKHHKPKFAIDTLCSHNYIGHFTVFDRKLTEKAGIFRGEFNGSQDYDLVLRYTDEAEKICHIPKLLYFRRDDKKNIPNDIRKKIENISTTEKVICDYLGKHDKPAQVKGLIDLPGFYRIIYELKENPLISIIIPNKDNVSLLRKCISSIMQRSTYENYEILIVENNSKDDATFAFYEELKRFKKIKILYWKEQGFNFSEICNYGVKYASGEHLVFLNNDVTIISPNWIEEMLMFSQRDDVGAVGVKLYYLNGSIQHAGLILGLGGLATHVYHSVPHDTVGYMGKLQIVQNLSIVTAACMMIKKRVFNEVGCFAPEFPNSFNDVDLCLKIRRAGYLIVWTPYAEAYHLESKSRGYNIGGKRKRKHAQDTAVFKARWRKELAAGDPYYNRNFSLEKIDYSVL